MRLIAPVRRTFALAAALSLAAIPLYAQADVVSDRQALMKQAGGATRTAAAIAKGDAPYDQAKVKEVFSVYLAVAEKAPELFPAGSDTGDTTASAKVWEDNAAFKAAFAQFGETAKKGLNSTDVEGFKTAFADIGKQCGACHQTFRVKR